MPAKIKLLAGLGNPGKEYAGTRHNAGAWWLQAVCNAYQGSLQQAHKFHGLTAKLQLAESLIYCILPTTFMNLSGKAIASIANYYAIAADEILVAHDELDFAAGVVRLKQGGGHGGHNGLRDIIAALQSKDFFRLRIGIAHPGHKDLVSNYVLHEPSIADRQAIDGAIDTTIALLPQMVNGNFAAAMAFLHK